MPQINADWGRFGTDVKQALLDLELDCDELADEMKCSVATAKRIEAGHSCSWWNMYRCCDLLGLDINSYIR